MQVIAKIEGIIDSDTTTTIMLEGNKESYSTGTVYLVLLVEGIEVIVDRDELKRAIECFT